MRYCASHRVDGESKISCRFPNILPPGPETTIKISGIDRPMSAAFDTINRRHLLEIVKSTVDEDEHRLIQFLLSGTVIDTRINGTSTSKPFTSNVGTPWGDSLSPSL